MNDRERRTADVMDSAISDHSQWEEPKRGPKSEKRQRAVVVSVRMTEEEMSVVARAADAEGMTMSGYLRNHALESARQHSESAARRPWRAVSNGTFIGNRLRSLVEENFTMPYLPSYLSTSKRG